MSKEKDRQVQAMRKMGMSEDEIAQLLADDKAIDRGEHMDFDLTPEQEKQAKKLANVGTKKKPTVFQLDNTKGKRSIKENPTKASLIAEIFQFLTEKSGSGCENVEITNKERQIKFKIGDTDYELTLIQKRKPKN